MLLIREEAVVVDHLEAVSTLTVVACVRLKNSTSLDEFIVNIMTLVALEAGFLHFRDDV